jgi:sodium-dependent dicarboxylate transporter 2/3/5
VLLAGIAIVLTEGLSNAAVVALLLPVALGIAKEIGMDPRIMAPVIAVPAGLGFAMPVGTPANAIAYSSGYLRMRDMLLPGLALDVVAWLGFCLVAIYYWPLIGLTP